MQRFYRYHELVYQKEANKRQLENNSRGTYRPPYWMVFKACFPQCFNTFLIFFVTLALFPSVQSDIQPSNKDFFVPLDYYSNVMCFLTFNITAMLGSAIASLVQWVCTFFFFFLRSFVLRYTLTLLYIQFLYSVYTQPSKKYLFIPVILRFVYLPLFLLCNYQPVKTERILPVLINDDWVYWIIAITMGLSSGYLSSLSMMYCPRYVNVKTWKT